MFQEKTEQGVVMDLGHPVALWRWRSFHSDGHGKYTVVRLIRPVRNGLWLGVLLVPGLRCMWLCLQLFDLKPWSHNLRRAEPGISGAGDRSFLIFF